MDIAAIRTALTDPATDLGFYAYSDVPTTPEFPCCFPNFPDELLEFASTGSCTMLISITVAVSRANEMTAQKQLSDALSGALVNAVMNAPRVHWSDIAFLSVNNIRGATFGDAECLAADINLSIRTK